MFLSGNGGGQCSSISTGGCDCLGGCFDDSLRGLLCTDDGRNTQRLMFHNFAGESLHGRGLQAVAHALDLAVLQDLHFFNAILGQSDCYFDLAGLAVIAVAVSQAFVCTRIKFSHL